MSQKYFRMPDHRAAGGERQGSAWRRARRRGARLRRRGGGGWWRWWPRPRRRGTWGRTPRWSPPSPGSHAASPPGSRSWRVLGTEITVIMIKIFQFSISESVDIYFDFPHLLRSWDRIDSWERPSSRLPRWDRWSRPRSCSLQLTYSQFYILLNPASTAPSVRLCLTVIQYAWCAHT